MGKLTRCWTVLRNSLVAIWRGEFLLRLRAGRFLAHILYTFLLFGLIIWVSLLIDTSMNTIEKNEKRISELRMEQSILKFEMTRATGRAAVGRRLEKMGSPLREPEKNATLITQ